RPLFRSLLMLSFHLRFRDLHHSPAVLSTSTDLHTRNHHTHTPKHTILLGPLLHSDTTRHIQTRGHNNNNNNNCNQDSQHQVHRPRHSPNPNQNFEKHSRGYSEV